MATREWLAAPVRRRSILAAARTVFTAQGFIGARTRDIAEEAGISEAILYQHFESKENLFEEAVLLPLEVEIDAMQDRIGKVVAECDPADRHDSMLRVETQLLKSMERIVPLLGVALFAGPRAGEDVFRTRVYRKLSIGPIADIPQILGWAERRIDQPTFLALWMSMAQGLVLDSLFSGKAIRKGKIADELATMLQFGLASPPLHGR